MPTNNEEIIRKASNIAAAVSEELNLSGHPSRRVIVFQTILSQLSDERDLNQAMLLHSHSGRVLGELNRAELLTTNLQESESEEDN